MGGFESKAGKKGNKRSSLTVPKVSQWMTPSIRLSENEVRWLYQEFVCRFEKRGPSVGELVREFPSLARCEILAVELFRVWNRSKTGRVSFPEVLLFVSAVGRGQLEQRFGWLFLLFDRDEDRAVDEVDLVRIEELVSDWLGVARVASNLSPFRMTYDQFVSGKAFNKPLFYHCLTLFDRFVLPVVEEMEKCVGTTKLFGRSLEYVCFREGSELPRLVSYVCEELRNRKDDMKWKSADDAEVVGMAMHVEQAWIKSSDGVIELLKAMSDSSLLGGILKKFLQDLPDPLVPPKVQNRSPEWFSLPNLRVLLCLFELKGNFAEFEAICSQDVLESFVKEDALEEGVERNSTSSDTEEEKLEALSPVVVTIPETINPKNTRDSFGDISRAVGSWLIGQEISSSGETLKVIAHAELHAGGRTRSRSGSRIRKLGGNLAGLFDVVVIEGSGFSTFDGATEIGIRVRVGKTQSSQVSVTKLDASPRWNFVHQFYAPDLQGCVVRVDVLVRGKVCGFVIMKDLDDLDRVSIEDWFPLQGANDVRSVTGELHLLLCRSGLFDLASGPMEVCASGERASCSSLQLSKLEQDFYPAILMQHYVHSSIFMFEPWPNINHLSPSMIFDLLTTREWLDDERNGEFVYDVLLSIWSWSTPLNFLQFLLGRFVGPLPTEIGEAKYREYVSRAEGIRGCVKKVLTVWINDPFLSAEFFKTPGLQEAVLMFCHDQHVPLQELNLHVQKRSFEKTARGPTIPSFREGTGRRRLESLFDLPCIAVAQQLTLMEHEILADIDLIELCEQNWTKESGPNVERYTEWFNRISAHFVTEIVSGISEGERAGRVIWLIKLASSLLELRNFNGVFEVLSALHCASVSRLHKTWNIVLQDKASSTTWFDIKNLASSSGNFSAYRKQLKASAGCATFPYLGLLLTDLTFTEEGNSTFSEQVGELNAEKLRLVAGCLRLFLGTTSIRYEIEECRGLRRLLQSVEGTANEKEFYELSLQREPREQ
jgi:Ca2+-binding EF-hand superfamily protein